MVGLMGRDTATTGGYDDGQAEGLKLVIGPWLGGVLGPTVGNIDVVGVVDGIYDGVSVGSKLGNELQNFRSRNRGLGLITVYII